ncbi:MAG: DUF4861 family protein [Candidatus Sumerlaeia bacterium]
MKAFVRSMVAIAAFLASGLCHAYLSSVFDSKTIAFDSTKSAQVRAATAGTRFWYDTNGDGKIEEVWYIDIDPRHTGTKGTVLVKCIDQDGDLAVGKEGDHDSDLYMVDLSGENGTGSADRAVVYYDYDHDNDMDVMAWIFNNSTTQCLWAYDVDDDNMLWFDQDFSYYQIPCQHYCHYTGERTSILTFDATNKVWMPSWESPFFFNDIDKNGVNDEVLRITVNPADTVATMRWGLDVNADGTLDDPRNYDCSISAFPLANTKIQGTVATATTLCGYPINSMLSYESGIAWVRGLTWQKGCFTWVENDNNVGYPPDSYSGERWEGVIVTPSTNFAKIGSPYCGPYNNRNEIELNPTGPFSYYYNPADHRIHLKGADEAWTLVDWNGDMVADMKYTFADASGGDGLIDLVMFDSNNDGAMDDIWGLDTSQAQTLAYDWETFKTAWLPVVRDYPAQLYELDRALAAALEKQQAGASADAVWSLIENKFANTSIQEWKRIKFLDSDIAMIYYLELVRDRQIVKLKASAGSKTAFWTTFEAARSAGMTDSMAYAVRQEFGITPGWADYATWVANLRWRDVQRVDSSTAWSNGVAWETEKAAWRIRNGRLDFLGKRDKRLVLDELTAGSSISTDTGGWGMDALDEGTGPGAGGLTLFINGTAYPIYGDSMTGVTYRVVEQTNEKVTVEMLATKVGPAAAPRTVQIRATAQAGRPDTQFSAIVTGGSSSDKLELGVGLIRPAENYYQHDKTAGILGIWGFQAPGIDWVGVGMVYQPAIYSRLAASTTELDVVLKATRGVAAQWTIQNEWRRGMRFNNWPVLANFMKDLTRTKDRLFPVRNAAGRDWLLIE